MSSLRDVRNALYKRRLELGLTAKEAAERMGTSGKGVWDAEQKPMGRRGVTVNKLARWSEALGMEMEIVFRAPGKELRFVVNPEDTRT